MLSSPSSCPLSSRPHPTLITARLSSNFGALPATVPLRPVAARVVASLHHFILRQFLCTTSSPWFPLRRAHASRRSSAASLPLTWPCLCGRPFTSQRARGQPRSGHLRPSRLLSKVTGELSLLTRYPTALIVAVAHLNAVAIAAGCPPSWRGPSTASRLMQPPPIVSRRPPW